MTFLLKPLKMQRPLVDAPITEEQEKFLEDLAEIRLAAALNGFASEHAWHRVDE